MGATFLFKCHTGHMEKKKELASEVTGASGNVRVHADLHPGGILRPLSLKYGLSFHFF